MPRDQWWSDDGPNERQLIERAKSMLKHRLCTTCYARDAKHEHLTKGGPGEKGADMKGLHPVFIDPQ
jgi:hypothetical protein